MRNNAGSMKRKDAKSRKLPMSFIVRIYRFSEDGPEGMVGVVETVANGKEKQFTGIRELGEILAGAGKSDKRMKTKGGSHGQPI
jgi:hypothetical protein